MFSIKLQDLHTGSTLKPETSFFQPTHFRELLKQVAPSWFNTLERWILSSERYITLIKEKAHHNLPMCYGE